MAAPTLIEVSVDSDQYSRYEPGRRIITATVVVSGGAPYASEEVLVDLVKNTKGRQASVATEALTLTGAQDTLTFSVEFDLEALVDSDHYHLARHGRYNVVATHVVDPDDPSLDIVGSSPEFKLVVMTTDRLKSDYLFGVDLKATEIRGPKFQPKAIGGVEIVEISKTLPIGWGTLTYNYVETDTANATASLGTGANGTVVCTADGTGYTGTSGNALTIEVTVPVGTSALSASIAGDKITVALDVTAGVPNAVANTATLIAAAVDLLAEVSAVPTGTGADSLGSATAEFGFTGGTTDISRLLSWNGGESVSITGPDTYILPAGDVNSPLTKVGVSTNNDYVCVKVTSLALLGTTPTSEKILISNEKMGEDVLCRYLEEELDYIENTLLATYVEPTIVVTDRDFTTIQFASGVQAPAPIFQTSNFDFIVSPLTYFRPGHAGSWISISTPYVQSLRVDNLFGAIANTRVIDIDLSWIEVARQGGLWQLVPFNQESAFDFVGLIWTNSLRGSTELPNFWHFQALVGLECCPGDIQSYLGKRAAMRALVAAGTALRPGVGSQSVGRDGVSQSTSYTSTATYGIYTGQITLFKEQCEEEARMLRGKYRGLQLAIV